MDQVIEKDEMSVSGRALLLGLYFMSLPLGVVELPIGGSVLKLIALLPIGVTAVYLLNPRNKFRLMSEHVVFVVLFFVILLSAQFSINKSASYKGIVSGLSLIVLFVISTGVYYSKKDVKWLVEASLWASRITAVLTLIFGGSIGDDRISLANSVFVEDANYLIGYFLIGVAYSLHKFLSKEYSVTSKLFNVIELVVYFYVILLTGSRGGAISVAVCILSYLVLRAAYYKETLRMTLIFLALIFLLVFTVIIGLRYIPIEVIQRFTIEAIADSGGTGRFDLWRESYKIYKDSPIWRQIVGYGSNTVLYIRVGDYRLWNVVHNFWFEKMLELGLFGLFSYLFISGMCIRRLFNKKNIMLFAAYLGIISLSMSLSLRGFKPWWNLMILLFIVSEHMRRENELRSRGLNGGKNDET